MINWGHNKAAKLFAATLFLFSLIIGLWFMKEASFDKGLLLAKRGKYIEAIDYLRPLAYLGDSTSQRLMADFYAYGWGVAKDEAEAQRWYDKLGAKKSGESQYFVGENYADGLGVDKDDMQADFWYRSAFERGYEPAKEKLGKKLELKN